MSDVLGERAIGRSVRFEVGTLGVGSWRRGTVESFTGAYYVVRGDDGITYHVATDDPTARLARRNHPVWPEGSAGG